MKYLKPFKLNEDFVNQSKVLDINTVSKLEIIFQEAIDEGYEVTIQDVLYEAKSPLNNFHLRMMNDFSVYDRDSIEAFYGKIDRFRRGFIINIIHNEVGEIFNNINDLNWRSHSLNPKMYDKIPIKLKEEGFEFIEDKGRDGCKYIITGGPFTIDDSNLVKFKAKMFKYYNDTFL